MTNPLNRSNRFASLPVLIALGLAPVGCDDKKEDSAKAGADAGKTADKGDTKKDPVAKGEGEAAADGGTEKPKEGGDGGVAATVLDAVANPPATAIPIPERGIALGWIMAPTIEGFMGELKAQVLPAKYAMYGDITTLKSMAGMLGEKSVIVQHFDFGKPVGCVAVEDEAAKIPIACFFGYEGGGAAVSTDVGDGKQPDAAGHAAFHKIEGQEIYIDDLGDAVVVTTHADLFGKTKPLLADTLLPHAKTQEADIEMVAYPSAAMKRYKKEVEGFMSLAGPSGSGTMDIYGEMEAFTYGFSIDPKGARFTTGVKALPGSKYAELIKQMSTGPVDKKWLSLPTSSWAVMAYNMASGKVLKSDSMKPLIEDVVKNYAKETGKDVATLTAAIDAFMTETASLYGNNVTIGLMHEPGTTGAAVLVAEKAADGRASWKTWSEAFTAEAVLPKKALKDVEWEFKTDAVTVDGVAADRWTIKAKKVKGGDIEKVAKRFGGKLDVTIDRFELSDRVVFVASLSDAEANDKAAIAAAKGGKTVVDAAGGSALMAVAPGAVSLGGVDLKRMFAWLGEVVPENKPYPAVGNDFADVHFYATMAGDRYDVDFVLNQPVIDQLKALIP